MTPPLALLRQTNTVSRGAHVQKLADSYPTAYFDRHPDEATLDGVAHGPHDRLPDNSPAAIARWQRREDAVLDQLRHINPRRLQAKPQAIAHVIMRVTIGCCVSNHVGIV